MKDLNNPTSKTQEPLSAQPYYPLSSAFIRLSCEASARLKKAETNHDSERFLCFFKGPSVVMI